MVLCPHCCWSSDCVQIRRSTEMGASGCPREVDGVLEGVLEGGCLLASFTDSTELYHEAVRFNDVD